MSSLEEVVVTGAATAGGQKKLDTSYSETTLTPEQIKEANAETFADLLKSSPGVWVESSGGPTGVNVEIAGFPGSGAPAYASFELNGAPIFPTSFQTNLEPTAMFRADDTLERVELVQGGPSVLYGIGAPALTMNYILKRGTDTPSGDLGVTYRSEGAERVDGFVSGPIDTQSRLYGSLGGFWTSSDSGVRDPQFAGEDGGQLTGSLARNWDTGSLLVFGRYLKYDAQFVTDTPLVNSSPGQFSPYPGFNPLTGSLESRADQYEQLQVAPCKGTGCTPGSIPINMADGRGPAMYTFGAEFNWNFGNGLQVLDDLAYTDGHVGMVALYSTSSTTAGENPETLAAYIAYWEKQDKLPAGLTASAYYTNTGAAAAMNQNVLTEELRYLSTDFHSLSNEVHWSADLFAGDTLMVGNYSAFFAVNELEYTGSDLLLQAQSNPAPIAVSLTNGTNTWQLSSAQGFVTAPAKAIQLSASGYRTAVFLSDSWKFEQWLFDAGARAEYEGFHDYYGNTAKGSLSGNAYQLYNSSAQYLTSGTTEVPYSQTGVSWTTGLNYEISPHMSAYLRANDGVHLAAFSEVSTSTPAIPLQKSKNYEIGYKYHSDFIYSDLVAFYRTFTGIAQSGSYAVNNTTETLSFIYGTKTSGLEYQVVLTPFTSVSGPLKGVSLAATGDYAHGFYADSSGCVVVTGLNNIPQTVCNASLDANGKSLIRQPKFQTRVTPAYTLPTDWGYVKAWATVEYVGNHYGDMYEQQYLGSYHDLSAGITGGVGQHWQWSVRGTNLTNQIALTEGNARNIGTAITANDVILARSIPGREVNVQVKYQF